MVKVIVAGCVHGELDNMYDDIKKTEENNSIKVDIVLCCGDFQAIRNKGDLEVLSVPPKYKKMGDFWRYYNGTKVAPYLTVFIGGNHEASNFLQELPYGGWVAENIYYLGYAGVINFKGIRIGGLSGIYKKHDYYVGHYEHAPYNDQTQRSAYHVRNIDAFRLCQVKKPVDIMMSHDWPRGICRYGNHTNLVKFKPHFKAEIDDNSLGNPAAEEILTKVRPKYWFAAHMHAKFCANVYFNDTGQAVKFLALDKCLPRRHYVQYLDIDPSTESNYDYLKLDPEWLCILKSTNHLMSISKTTCIMPENTGSSFVPTDEDVKELIDLFKNQLKIPNNFEPTAKFYDPTIDKNSQEQPELSTNPQTDIMCAMLEIINPNEKFLGKKPDIARLNKKLIKNNEDSLSEDDENPDEICLESESDSSCSSNSDKEAEDSNEYNPIKSLGDGSNYEEENKVDEVYNPTNIEEYEPENIDDVSNEYKPLENEYQPTTTTTTHVIPEEYKPEENEEYVPDYQPELIQGELTRD